MFAFAMKANSLHTNEPNSNAHIYQNVSCHQRWLSL